MGTLDVSEMQGSSWGPPGPDGGPAITPMPPPVDARPFTPVHSPCLRACRHYFNARSHFDHGNPAGTFDQGKEPTQRHHLCMRIPGVYLELSGDSPVYECNRWDPENPSELVQLRARRDAYFEAHPDHVPPPPLELSDDLDHIGTDDDQEATDG